MTLTEGDGYNTTIVLDCGHTLRLNGAGNWRVGDWTSCAAHSATRGYDPDYGTPNYHRDRRVVDVLRDEPAGDEAA